MTPKQRLVAAVAGTVGVALCCFTPLLAITLVAVGLGALSPYLDVVLLTALAILIVVTGLSYRQYARARKDSGAGAIQRGTPGSRRPS
ncbi:MAG: mercury resistance system transport protein MerF [Acidobacteria bacterium]|nr:mercury resistance system transport protein MerF [Acidobacteriota bacterium]